MPAKRVWSATKGAYISALRHPCPYCGLALEPGPLWAHPGSERCLLRSLRRLAEAAMLYSDRPSGLRWQQLLEMKRAYRALERFRRLRNKE